MSALAATMLGIVIQNQVPLRAAPRDSAAQQSLLWQGELLELRGEKGDYLYVYDHRLERGGYVRASQVRAAPLSPESAPDLLSVMRFLRDTPGSEALGISYAAAYLRAVPRADLTAEPLDALGVMADRLAQRASRQQTKAAASHDCRAPGGGLAAGDWNAEHRNSGARTDLLRRRHVPASARDGGRR